MSLKEFTSLLIMKNPATPREKEYMKAAVSLGCTICGRPACLHHPTFGRGRAQKTSNMLVIPLCPEHHQFGVHGIAIHAGQKAFENRFGTEIELLEKVYKRLKLPFPPKELTELVDKQRIGYRIGFKTP